MSIQPRPDKIGAPLPAPVRFCSGTASRAGGPPPAGEASMRSAQTQISERALVTSCQVEGVIESTDLPALPVRLCLNLPEKWKGRALQASGGEYRVPAGTDSVPGAPVPLARGFRTFGSDSCHQGGDTSFALNDEALKTLGMKH